MPGADHAKLAIEWIKQGKDEEVFSHFSKLNIQDYDQFARDIIASSPLGESKFLQNIELFPELSSDIAWFILADEKPRDYSIYRILRDAYKFKNLNLEKIKAFLIKNEMYGVIFDQYEKFNMTFTQAVQLAIDAKAYYAILENIDTHNESYLSESSSTTLNGVSKILTEENRWDVIIIYRRLFSDMTDDEIIDNYIKYFGIDKFLQYIPNFQGIDAEVAHALIKADHIECVGENIDLFW